MKGKIEKVLNEIIEICTVHGDIHEIILFGSRAKGTYLPKSDIDIAIKGKCFDLDILNGKIESVDTLLTIDLVDIENCHNELLKREVKKYGISLYSKI